MNSTAQKIAPVVNSDIIAHDFRTALTGKMPQAQLDAAVTKLTTDTAYAATGSVASLIFYLQFQVNVSGGKSFNGKAGGVSTPGGGALIGTVYTDDINALYANTVSFEFQGTPVYLSILFFDGNSNLLGHFQAGAISTVTGVGGGSGSWS